MLLLFALSQQTSRVTCENTPCYGLFKLGYSPQVDSNIYQIHHAYMSKSRNAQYRYASDLISKAVFIKNLEGNYRDNSHIPLGFYPLKQAIKYLFPAFPPSERTIRRWLSKGHLPHVKIGHSIYVSLSDSILAFARQTIENHPDIKPKEMSKEETVKFLTKYTDISTEEAESFVETTMKN